MARYYTWTRAGADPGARSQFNFTIDRRVVSGSARAFPSKLELLRELLPLATEPGGVDGAEFVELHGEAISVVVPSPQEHLTGVFVAEYRVLSRRPLKATLDELANDDGDVGNEAKNVLLMRAITEGEDLPEG